MYYVIVCMCCRSVYLHRQIGTGTNLALRGGCGVPISKIELFVVDIPNLNNKKYWLTLL